MRYFFDLRDGDELVVDEEGMELGSIERVQEEAALSLADIARDRALTHGGNGVAHSTAIQVRDERGLVLRASITFEVDHHRH